MTAAKIAEHTAPDGTTYYSNGGCGRFRSKELAQQAADNRAKLAAAVNRKGMTAEEKAAAFVAFFAKPN